VIGPITIGWQGSEEAIADIWNCRASSEVAEALGDLREWAEGQLAQYPTDVFPPPDPGCKPDRYSAAMARHVYGLVLEEIGDIKIGE
jgi:hypothetical protein